MTKYSELWEKNWSSRNPEYSLRGKLLDSTTPVAQLICLCPDLEDVRPLKVQSNVIINWETGLFHHRPGCDRPLQSMVQNCNGCFENFWGYKKDLVCAECKPYY